MREAEAAQESRRQYLLSVTDVDSVSLSAPDWYDRIRYLRELDAVKHLHNIAMKNLISKPVASKPVEKTAVYREWAWDEF